MLAGVIWPNRFGGTRGRESARTLKEVKDLTSHVASAKSTDALFCGNHNFDAPGKPVAIEPKRLAREAFCFIPNCCRARTRPKG